MNAENKFLSRKFLVSLLAFATCVALAWYGRLTAVFVAAIPATLGPWMLAQGAIDLRRAAGEVAARIGAPPAGGAS